MLLSTKQFIDNLIGALLVGINLPLAKGLGFLLGRDHTLKKAPKHILVIKILGLGSVVLASDALMALRKRYPEAKLILLCGKAVGAGIKPLKLFDEVWVVEDRNIVAFAVNAIHTLFKAIRLPDLWTIDLEVYSRLTTIFSLWTLALNRFGFQLSRVNWKNYLNTHNVYFNQFNSVADNYHELVKATGVTEFESQFEFPAYPINGRKEEGTKPYIAINNTCSDLSLERKLPQVTLAAICQWIEQNTPYKIALLGGPSDAEGNQQFIKNHLSELNPDRVYNTAGQLSFEAYYEFLHEQCAFMITIDSAPLHIGRKLGLPTLSLWGPTSPEHIVGQSTEEQARHLIYYLSVSCSPCVHHTEVLPCGGDNFCMKNLQTTRIIQLIQQLQQTLTTPIEAA